MGQADLGPRRTAGERELGTWGGIGRRACDRRVRSEALRAGQVSPPTAQRTEPDTGRINRRSFYGPTWSQGSRVRQGRMQG